MWSKRHAYVHSEARIALELIKKNPRNKSNARPKRSNENPQEVIEAGANMKKKQKLPFMKLASKYLLLTTKTQNLQEKPNHNENVKGKGSGTADE